MLREPAPFLVAGCVGRWVANDAAHTPDPISIQLSLCFFYDSYLVARFREFPRPRLEPFHGIGLKALSSAARAFHLFRRSTNTYIRPWGAPRQVERSETLRLAHGNPRCCRTIYGAMEKKQKKLKKTGCVKAVFQILFSS